MADEPAAAAPPAADGTSFTASSIPEKRPRINVYWNRPKSHLYEYNYDYGSYYYQPQINYLNQRSQGIKTEIPRAMNWGERALTAYMDRARRDKEFRFAKRLTRDDELLTSMRSSTYQYIAHTKSYARKVTTAF